MGIGEIPDLGPLCTWARRAGFSVLGLLPMHEVLPGESSPYSAASAFALDPAYLGTSDCEDVAAVGGQSGLGPADQALLRRLKSAPTIAWGEVRDVKDRLLHAAYVYFRDREINTGSARARAFAAFVMEQRGWIDDYALFVALHRRHGGPWWNWRDGLRNRNPGALHEARAALGDEIQYRTFLQWLAHAQWTDARTHARGAGVQLMGDLPFVVAGDSADVWARQGDFRLDLRAGVPPDAFSDTGQDWGLPVYNWEAMAGNGFAWMRERAARAGSLYSLCRVDHVIGLYRTYWRASDGSRSGFSPDDENSQIANGERVLGIFKDELEVIAEDLGVLPEFLPASLSRLDIPGYRVLRWERDGAGAYRDPATWPTLSVATTGTHDTETIAAWWEGAPAAERAAFVDLPGLHGCAATAPFSDNLRDAILGMVYAAPSRLAMLPLQDALGTRDRINVPGLVSPDNWSWRLPTDINAMIADRTTIERLAALAREAKRR